MDKINIFGITIVIIALVIFIYLLSIMNINTLLQREVFNDLDECKSWNKVTYDNQEKAFNIYNTTNYCFELRGNAVRCCDDKKMKFKK